MKRVTLLILIFISIIARSQPYLDIFSIKFQHSPGAGLWRNNYIENKFTFINVNLNIPVQFKKDSSVLLLSPAAELWNTDISNLKVLPGNFQALIFPITLIKPLSPVWTFTATAIIRWNGNNKAVFDRSFQKGGAALFVYKKRKDLQYKFGVYYNSEFFGTFIMPLAGIDWQISKRDNLFGILPGSLLYEHKVTNHFYWGAGFRAITNSYRIDKDFPDFFRIDENQLFLYADLYLIKKIIINGEAGHSLFRKMRLGFKNDDEKYYYKNKINDALLFKISLLYRIRFR